MFGGHSFAQLAVARQTNQTNEFVLVFVGESAEGTSMNVRPATFVLLVLAAGNFLGDEPIEEGRTAFAVLEFDLCHGDRVGQNDLGETEFVHR